MANIKSQIKRNRQTIKRQARNKSVRSELRTRTKRAIADIDTGAEDGEEALRLAIKRIDKAAAKGVIHKNQAANRKSRLMSRAARATEAGRGLIPRRPVSLAPRSGRRVVVEGLDRSGSRGSDRRAAGRPAAGTAPFTILAMM